MKILYQGGFKQRNDDIYRKTDFLKYIDEFARQLVRYNHQVVLTDDWEYDNLIAEKVLENLNGDLKASRKYVLYYLSERVKSVPSIGMVKKYKAPKYWTNERTIQTQFSDCLLVIGGGKGTGDCMEKAFLSKKPIFIAYSVSDYPSTVWDEHAGNYFYLKEGDSDFITDLNQTPEDFFFEVFNVINQLEVKGKTSEGQMESKSSSQKITQIRKLISDGLLEKSIESLMDSSKNIDAGLSNQIIILAGQYRSISRNKNLGLGEKSEEEARIMLAVLNILDELHSNNISLE